MIEAEKYPVDLPRGIFVCPALSQGLGRGGRGRSRRCGPGCWGGGHGLQDAEGHIPAPGIPGQLAVPLVDGVLPLGGLGDALTDDAVGLRLRLGLDELRVRLSLGPLAFDLRLGLGLVDGRCWAGCEWPVPAAPGWPGTSWR